jgi:hypothetical protein
VNDTGGATGKGGRRNASAVDGNHPPITQGWRGGSEIPVEQTKWKCGTVKVEMQVGSNGTGSDGRAGQRTIKRTRTKGVRRAKVENQQSEEWQAESERVETWERRGRKLIISRSNLL